jgi:hypothetical protein
MGAVASGLGWRAAFYVQAALCAPFVVASLLMPHIALRTRLLRPGGAGQAQLESAPLVGNGGAFCHSIVIQLPTAFSPFNCHSTAIQLSFNCQLSTAIQLPFNCHLPSGGGGGSGGTSSPFNCHSTAI